MKSPLSIYILVVSVVGRNDCNLFQVKPIDKKYAVLLYLFGSPRWVSNLSSHGTCCDQLTGSFVFDRIVVISLAFLKKLLVGNRKHASSIKDLHYNCSLKKVCNYHG